MAAIKELQVVDQVIDGKINVHDIRRLNGPRIEDSTLVGRIVKARGMHKADSLQGLAQIALYVHLSKDYVPFLKKPNGNSVIVPVGEYIPIESNDRLKFPLSAGGYFTVSIRDEKLAQG